MKQYKGTGIYLIREQAYPKTGLPSFGNSIGPSDIQLVKTVFQLVKEQDVFYKDTLLSDSSKIGLWDSFKMAMGVDVRALDKPHGDLILRFEYCGFTTFITPLDGFDRLLPSWFSTKQEYHVPTPYTFGHDPVKNIELYRNITYNFFVSNGGDGVPQAIVKYNSHTKEIKKINSEAEYSKIAKELTRITNKRH